MDLNENIRIAAEVYSKHGENKHYRDLEVGFIDGAKSQQAKEYWFAEFKQELKSLDNSQEDEQILGSLRRVGIVGHGPSLGCELQARQYGKTELLREVIQSAKEQGIQVVVVGGSNNRLIQEIPDFKEEIGAIETQLNCNPEVFKIYNYDIVGEYPLSIQEPKAWDRKKFPNKMNNYKSKKRNKR